MSAISILSNATAYGVADCPVPFHEGEDTAASFETVTRCTLEQILAGAPKLPTTGLRWTRSYGDLLAPCQWALLQTPTQRQLTSSPSRTTWVRFSVEGESGSGALDTLTRAYAISSFFREILSPEGAAADELLPGEVCFDGGAAAWRVFEDDVQLVNTAPSLVQEATGQEESVAEELLPGELSYEEIAAIISRYEDRFQMSSKEFLQRVSEGTAPDTFETMDWMILLRNL